LVSGYALPIGSCLDPLKLTAQSNHSFEFCSHGSLSYLSFYLCECCSSHFVIIVKLHSPSGIYICLFSLWGL